MTDNQFSRNAESRKVVTSIHPRSVLALSLTAATVILFLLLLFSFKHNPTGSELLQNKLQAPSPPDVETAGFCRLVTAPDDYLEKVVRTQAIYSVNKEYSYLYDLSCDSENLHARVLFEPSVEEVMRANKEAFELLRPGHPDTSFGLNSLARRAIVTVTGKISKTPGVGHLGSFDLTFKIFKIERARPVPTDIPWP